MSADGKIVRTISDAMNTDLPEVRALTGAESRVYNFSAGPSMMPLDVLLDVQTEMLNHKKSGMSVMEMSHRSKEFVQIAQEAEKDMRDLLKIPDDYKVIFLQGGATLQFSCVPFNMFGGPLGSTGDYLVTGQWGEKAMQEANKYGKGVAACNTKATKFTTIPKPSEWKHTEGAALCHYTANETVNGVEFHSTPDVKAPLVADMSSNFLSKDIEVAKHACIYAGLQKNLGPAGCVAAIMSPEYASGKHEQKLCPTYCSWKIAAQNDSMYNTPPCFTWYIMAEVLKYTKKIGGVAHWNELSDKKAGMIYRTIDESNGFYTAPVAKDARSRMNVPFTIMGDDPALTKKFLEDAKKVQLFTLAGHRSVGGIRASLYNGMPLKGVETLNDFMKSFMDENRK